MSCCPPAPKVTPGSGINDNPYLQETDINPGENAECFQKAAGDSTGRNDDKTEDIVNKIRNVDIPMITVPNDNAYPADLRGKSGVFVDTLFRLTPNSTKQAAIWELKGDDGNNITLNTITFATESLPSSNDANIGNGARMKGAFLAEHHNKVIKVKVTAKESGGAVIDTRAFTFSPALSNSSDEITLRNPLPGQPISSKFGPRKPPTTGASSFHNGIDLNTPGTAVNNVLAAADGTVEFVGWYNGGGNVIKLKHLNGSGKHLCSTVYMHLSKQLVSQGQKVSAGQVIGVEGNTGVGTGPHLHFEVRLPDGKAIDPEPYIFGGTKTFQSTNPDNTGKAGTDEDRPASKTAKLNEATVKAKTQCEPLGPGYPKAPNTTNNPVPNNPITDPFERAWFYTMKHEVGPHWTQDYPNDPEVQQGLIETQAQRKKCGYVDKPGFPGGNTKFGIAAGPNRIQVEPLTYAEAKKMGYNNYWTRGSTTPASLAGSKPKTAIILFDINYLHGTGNANKIWSAANITSGMSDVESADALTAAQKKFMNSIYEANPGRNGKYIKGWLTRATDINSYAKST